MAVNMYSAFWTLVVCVVVTIGVSLFTRPKPDAELKNLVMGLTPLPDEGPCPWYEQPAALGDGRSSSCWWQSTSSSGEVQTMESEHQVPIWFFIGGTLLGLRRDRSWGRHRRPMDPHRGAAEAASDQSRRLLVFSPSRRLVGRAHDGRGRILLREVPSLAEAVVVAEPAELTGRAQRAPDPKQVLGVCRINTDHRTMPP